MPADLPLESFIVLARYAFRRLLWVIPVIIGASILAFVIMHAAPGSPWSREGRQLPPFLVARLNEELHLDEPLPVQYLVWLQSMLSGNMGLTTSTHPDPVGPIILEAAIPSLQLGLMAFTLALVVGVSVGIVAALRDRKWQGYLATGIAVLGMAAPAFALAALLQLFWPTAPQQRPGGPFSAPTPPGGWEEARQWVLPVISLAALPMAMIARHTKGAMLEVLHSDYVRTAQSKGLSEQRIASHHLFRNSLIPLVTITGPLLAVLITGSVVVERVFQIPGLGLLYWGAIRARDFGLLMGITVIYAAAIAIINALVDIGYGWIDPRIRLTGTNDG